MEWSSRELKRLAGKRNPGEAPKTPEAESKDAPIASPKRAVRGLAKAMLQLEAAGTGTAAPRKLSLTSQTVFAEVLEQVRGANFARTFGSLSGSFSVRTKGGGDYVYFRTYEGPGAVAQEFYIGPDDESTRALVSAYRERRKVEEAWDAARRSLVSMLEAGGLTLTDPGSARIIRGFANAGVFRLGGVLVGTHAFVAIGNLLGVAWPSALQTRDVDLGAFAKRIEIGMPQTPELMADRPSTIDALGMGFIPSLRLDPAEPPTSYVVPRKDWRIDLVTTPLGRDREAPVRIPRFKASAQPLEFMDYLLERTAESLVLSDDAVLVRVPLPARFGVHKLLVASNRDEGSAAKADKDRVQAFHLLSYLAGERPGDVELAMGDALKRGPSWRRRIQEEVRRMVQTVPLLLRLLQ